MLIGSVSCSSDDTTDDATSINSQILSLINNHRESIGKSGFKFNATANTLANEHSLYMLDKGKLSYDNSNDRLSQLKKNEGIVKFLESVAYKYNSAVELVDALLKDSGHLNNIESDCTHIGIGANIDDSDIYYYSLIFIKK